MKQTIYEKLELKVLKSMSNFNVRESRFRLENLRFYEVFDIFTEILVFFLDFGNYLLDLWQTIPCRNFTKF